MRAIFVLIWLFCAPLLATPLSVKLQQSAIKQGQSFVLTLQLFHDNELKGGIEPNFSHLSPTFSLITSKRTSFANFVNGGVERGTRWQLTLTSNFSGKLEIPAIKLGVNHSDAIEIEVAGSTLMPEKTRLASPIKQQSLPTSTIIIVPSILWWQLALVAVVPCWWLYRKRQKLSLWRACRRNDYATAQGLLLAYWDCDNLGSLAKQLNDQVLVDAIMSLDRYIYGKSSSPWQGKPLWHAFKERQHHEDPVPKTSLLPELYLQSKSRK